MKEREKIIRVIPFFMFIVLLVSTSIAWGITRDAVKSEIRRNFNQEVQVVKFWMQDRLNLYLPMSLGIRIFFESSDKITANEWSSYIRRLKLIDKYPGISAITYIERNENAYIVKYIEPVGKNRETLGTNLALDPKRLEILNKVRDEDPISTGRVALITTPEKGFKITLPVYRGPASTTVEDQRKNLKGFVEVDFAGNTLFQDIFDVVDSTNLTFEVYSGLPSKENLLYDQSRDYSALIPNYRSEMTTRDAFEYNSQTWYLVAAAKPDFKLTPVQERLPLIVLGSGIVFSFMFLGIYLFNKKYNQVFS